MGNANLRSARQEVHVVVVHLGRERRALLLEVRHELAQRRRVEDGARERMRADFARLLEHGDRQRLAALLFLELRQAQRGRHPGGAAADDQDVDFEGFTIHAHSAVTDHDFITMGTKLTMNTKSQVVCSS